MSRKIALKRLTASDLTLFKWHFLNRPAGKQKAFNLDARILVTALYPMLGHPSSVPIPRYPIDLDLLGPGLMPAHNLQRKILKQQKNWRLNGEFIDNPDDFPGRYNTLSPGDFAVFEFSGDIVPMSAKVILISSQVEADQAIHHAFDLKHPSGSMWLLSEDDISAIVESTPPPEGHPLYDWIDGEAIEDAVLGGSTSIAKINKRRAGRGISPQDFVRSREAAERNGVLGEEFVNEHFQRLLTAGEIGDIEWTSSINAVSPYDFILTNREGSSRLIDAKSTTGRFQNSLHMSFGEIYEAVCGTKPYDIYRIYDLNERSAKLRICENIGLELKSVFDAINALPTGISVDSISIRPDALNFLQQELVIEWDAEDNLP